MKQNYLTLPEDSTEVLRGCFWAVTMSAPFILFILFTWMAVQRAEILYERDWRLGLGRELEIERGEWNRKLAAFNQRIANADAARTAAEAKASAALDAKSQAEAQFAQVVQELSSLRAAGSVPVSEAPSQASLQSADTPTQMSAAVPVAEPPPAVAVPSAADITDFVRAHLARMMGPVAGQLVDYAQYTDFHDKPHASWEAIAIDRSRWEERWPRRLIYKDDVTPEVVFSRDPDFNWVATAEFNWRWVFWGRTGSVIQGVYHDTWKIAPAVGGLKIISEHSVDAATGRSRD